MEKTLKILLVIAFTMVIVWVGLTLYYNNLKSQPIDTNTPVENPASKPTVEYKIVNLSNKGLTSLSTEFFNKEKDCEELNVSDNKLTGALPAEIRLMSELKMINASNNNLTGIPAEIGQLKQLEVLDLSNNKIDTMPNEIENIKGNLKILNLSGNTYSKETIGRIKQMLPDTQVISD